ncbi:MAG: DAK2 domain-containing protein [Chloroflexota bacterium]
MEKIREVKVYDGEHLGAMVVAATSLLEKNASVVNALNVFPVPDGDTGTNMLLTMRATVEEASQVIDRGAWAVAQAMARGALMGARGNSGVILSQILHGLAVGLQGKESFQGQELATALREASAAAYKGVARPVEGTILTVMRQAAEAAQATALRNSHDAVDVLEATVEAARASVMETQHMLPALRDAGVVDAGGQGLYIILKGALHHLKGETDAEIDVAEAPATMMVVAATPTGKYGYCTEFLLHGQNLSPDEIRRKLMNMGESLMVVGDENTVRTHIHTLDPGAVIGYATVLGTLHQVKIQNMDEQHQDFAARAKAKLATGEIAVVAVAPGDGLREVFYSLGAAEVVPGGETMNPSVQELLAATQTLVADQVIILPNNPNVVPAARQASVLAGGRVEVVPTESIPQGVAALLAFDSLIGLEANLSVMEEARHSVRSGRITAAVRSMRLGDIAVSKGQFIALLEEEMVAASDTIKQVLGKLLKKMDVKKGGLVTLYFGSDAAPEEAEELAESLLGDYPGIEVEMVRGGQPYYHYIVSVE